VHRRIGARDIHGPARAHVLDVSTDELTIAPLNSHFKSSASAKAGDFALRPLRWQRGKQLDTRGLIDAGSGGLHERFSDAGGAPKSPSIRKGGWASFQTGYLYSSEWRGGVEEKG
jgi:hypothetical protein